MGNPSIPSSAAEPAGPAVPMANGILANVSGDLIAAASSQLPAAGPDLLHEHRDVVIEVPSLGPVRIGFRLNSYRHGKSRHWHWLAVHAAAEAETPKAPDR